MTAATNIITLALKTAGVVGVGQTPLAQDLEDCFIALSEMIVNWANERTVAVIPGNLPPFPDMTTDVPFWDNYEAALLWGLTQWIRPLYGMPEDPQVSRLAQVSIGLLQANNKQFQPSPNPGFTATAQQVIYRALRACGRVTDTQSVAVGSQDVQEGFAALVEMLGQWQRKRWLVYSLAELVVVANGAAAYTVGTNGNFDIVRPDRLESAFARLINGGLSVDYPLEVLDDKEDYNLIAFKQLQSFPSLVYYDPAYPTGTAYFWPIPQAGAYELHLFTKTNLQKFSSISDPLLAPPEYVQAMVYNLAVDMGLTFGLDVKPGLVNKARATLNTIRNANLQVPELGMPDGMPRLDRSILGGGWLGGIALPREGGSAGASAFGGQGEFSDKDFGSDFLTYSRGNPSRNGNAPLDEFTLDQNKLQ